MQLAVLLADENASRRGAMRDALDRHRVPALQVSDAFEAMAALGRAEFGCLVIGDGRRRLSLRGLCHLARRRHPNLHICVLLPPLADEASARASLGVPVTVFDGALGEEELVERIVALMKTPLDPLAEQPSVAAVDQAIAEAYADAEGPPAGAEATVAPTPDPEPAPDVPMSPQTLVTAPPTAEAPPGDTLPDVAARPEWEAPSFGRPRKASRVDALLEGVLDAETAPALLMGIFAQELTGRLEISGGHGEGTLYFYCGEPVAADHVRGNAGMLEELEARDLVPAGLDIRFVPEGELLATMVTAGNVTGGAMMTFVLEHVRHRLLELAMQHEGTYRFIEDARFLDVAPLVRVNPFDVVLQTRRDTTMPTEVQTRADEIAAWWIAPRPALRLAAGKLSPFIGDRAIDEIIGECTKVKDFLDAARLDEISGTLLLDTLVSARLVELTPRKPAPRLVPEVVRLGDSQPNLRPPQLHVPEASSGPVPAAAPDSLEEAALREEVLSLYMRLKPLSHPRQVLGVALHADTASVEAAYRSRMQELDPRRVPEAMTDREALVARISELRAKVMNAMEALQYQAGAPAGAALPSVTSDDDGTGGNPF